VAATPDHFIEGRTEDQAVLDKLAVLISTSVDSGRTNAYASIGRPPQRKRAQSAAAAGGRITPAEGRGNIHDLDVIRFRSPVDKRTKARMANGGARRYRKLESDATNAGKHRRAILVKEWSAWLLDGPLYLKVPDVHDLGIGRR
jgi:hypothetical protein